MQIKAYLIKAFLWFIPPSLHNGNPKEFHKAKLSAGFAFALGLSGLPFAFDAMMGGNHMLTTILLFGSFTVFFLPLLLRATGNVWLVGHIFMFCMYFITFSLTWSTTGLISTSLMWTCGIPLTAILLLGLRAGLFWTLSCVAMHTLFFVLEQQGMKFQITDSASAVRLDWYLSWAGLTTIIFILARIFEKNRSDVQEQLVKANKKLSLDKETAVEASTAKSSFLASMSHEIRTPLNAIIGYSELLLEEAADMGIDDFHDDLVKVNVSGKHLLALINDILDLSKIEAGHMDLNYEPFSVKKLLGELDTTAAPLMAKNNNTFSIFIEEGIGEMIADLSKVRQSLLNLLSNASKFTEEGEIKLRTSLVTRNDTPWISFRVTDTGIGMSEMQLGKLFQEYSQAESTTHKKYGGTGLGLALSQGFCQLMGGSIQVESKLGQGTTFEILLPFLT